MRDAISNHFTNPDRIAYFYPDTYARKPPLCFRATVPFGAQEPGLFQQSPRFLDRTGEGFGMRLPIPTGTHHRGVPAKVEREAPLRNLSARVLLLALAFAAASSAPLAQSDGKPWTPAGYLVASNPGEDDHLGAGNALTGVALQVSRDGRTLAVAAPHEDSVARGINGNEKDDSAFDSGAVYVFTQNQTAWVQQAYLKASNAQSGDQFGFAVALSGDGNTLAVGANFEDGGAAGIDGNQADESAPGAGAVYVFVRNGATWTQQAYIKASNIGEGDRFGYSLALSDDGNTLAAGAIGEDSVSTGTTGNQADNSAEQAGATYVFTRSGGTWTQQAYLKASNTQAG